MSSLDKRLLIPALLIIGFAFGAVYYGTSDSAKVGSFNPTGGGTYALKSSISSTQTSIALSSFAEPGSNIAYTMSYLGSDIEYATINPSSGNSEFVSFTGITQNSDGSATLTGVTRGLARTPGTGGCVASSTLAHGYSGQTQFVLSNPPCFYAEFAKLRNTQSVTGAWTFASTAPPRLDSVAAQASGTYIATTSEFASIAYVDAIAIAGVSNATQSVKGVVQVATALQAASTTALAGGSTGATLVLPTSIATDTPTSGCASGYSSTAGAGCSVIATLSGKIRQTFLDIFTTVNTWTGLQTFSGGLTISGASSVNATTTVNAAVLNNNFYTSYTAGETITAGTPVSLATSSVAVYKALGNLASTTQLMGIATTSATAGQTIYIQTEGIVSGLSGLTAGQDYYSSDSATISSSVGTNEIYLGKALSSTKLMLQRNKSWQYNGTSGSIGSGSSTTVPAFTKYIVLNWSVSYASAAGNGSATLGINGPKTTDPQVSGCCALTTGDMLVIWSPGTWGNSSTMKGILGGSATAGSFTAYFYR